MFQRIRKRDGRLEKFDAEKIVKAIERAGVSTGEFDEKIARRLMLKVINLAEDLVQGTPTVEQIQDIVEEVLLSSTYKKSAKGYVIYREQHKQMRGITDMENVSLVEQYLKQLDWQVNENSNMTFSLQGLNNYISSEISKVYWLHKIYPVEIKDAYLNGDFHLHDLNILSVYCVGWDLFDLLQEGFRGVPGKIASKPPKHFRAALGQVVNFFYTLQGEAAGAQAISNFDTLLAPFIRYDNLDYENVKQAMQEFVFNINVPTRVGFQCMSEDTDILTADGWKSYNEVKKGDLIKTFNVKSGKIEEQKVNKVFSRHYKGVMYNLKNRIQDQLISPNHRVVRKLFNTENYTLQPIEEVTALKSPFIIPVAADNSVKDAPISDEQIKLMAWITAEGTVERPTKHRCCYRVSVYQSKEKNRKNYDEIVGLLKFFKLSYDEGSAVGLGSPVQRMRLNAEDSRVVHKWYGTRDSVAFIPPVLLNLSQRQSRLFLETYLKADGFEDCKIATTDAEILEGLQIMAVNAGYGFTTLTRKPTIGKKDIFVLRLIKHQESYIQTVKKVDYDGTIWCPNTKNETVIARRNGKVFITGNTPFTNITMDLNVPSYYKDQPVIIGGKPQKETYKEYQKEMDMLNRAFFEIMSAGDASGRVFTFPIPTYNITKDFDWDNENLSGLWEMSAKYGIPYFSNFVNSDMKPEDARSMCCRLRIDNRELKKRGGGLFGANPLTGSIGVVTINLPRLGYLAKNEIEFLERLERLMTLAKMSLEIKRKVLEKLTEGNLYPYAKHYLRNIKKRYGVYWQNHFSTIGILGMNEACLNLFKENIASEKGMAFSLRVLDFMRKKLEEFQNETGHIYNLEATPAEGTSYRLARKDKEKHSDIVCANEEEVKKGAAPFYTNSTHLPVNFTDDVFEALDLQDPLQVKYTGGTVVHIFVGERLKDGEVVKNMVKKICEKYHLPYFTFSPTFSVCPNHGYVSGEHPTCPVCNEKCEVYSRIVGYIRPVNQWHNGKKAEFKVRKTFKVV